MFASAFEYQKSGNGGSIVVTDDEKLDRGSQTNYRLRIAIYDSKDAAGDEDWSDPKSASDRDWVDAYLDLSIHLTSDGAVAWEIGNGVPEPYVATALDSSEIIALYLRSIGLVERGRTEFHLYDDARAMSLAFRGTPDEWDVETVSSSRRGGSYVYTGNRWVRASPENLATTVAAELVTALTGAAELDTDSWPAWYQAGQAWFLARQALSQAGFIPYEVGRANRWGHGANAVEADL